MHQMEFLSATVGALLTPTFESLYAKMSYEIGLLNSHKKVRAEVQNWKHLLPQIKVFLEDAEEKQLTDQSVRLWHSQLRSLAYDMENLLDELKIDSRRSLLISQASSSRTWKLDPGFFKKRFGSMHDREVALRLEHITVRLQRMVDDANALNQIGLLMNVGDKSCKVAQERFLTSALPEDHICGREDDVTSVLQMLREDRDLIIPIVGTGGIGKTTLAQLVYNDQRLEGRFDVKAWVCVSDEFDVHRITRAIFEQLTGERCDIGEFAMLQERLKGELSQKRFLIVLDDVWNETYGQWDILQKPFLSRERESKIIVTTRNKGVGIMMRGDDGLYCLDYLEDDVCLSLFAQHALGTDNFEAHPHLEEFGKEIVRRCKGLPLAVKSLGGLLRGKLCRDEWEDILNSEIWHLPEDKSNILPALMLSYNRLPSCLKQCFAYCAIFPKDYEFEEDELVLLWMAEGLLEQQLQGRKQNEDLGHHYFRALLSRTLFQQSKKDKLRYVMHDLIHDLALLVAGDFCCNLDNILEKENARHLSFSSRRYDTSKRFECLDKQKNLRTFMLLKQYEVYDDNFLSDKVVSNLLACSPCLRVLCLGGYNVRKIPNSIEDMKHLRHIDLSGAVILSLPESVGSLLSLLTLILRNCNKLTTLPASIGNLVDLHHLDITNTQSLQNLPPEICHLTSLQTLSKFIVGKAEHSLRLRDLKNLSLLRGRFSILDLHNVLNVSDAKNAKLHDKKKLEDLSLKWTPDFSNPRDGSKELEVLESLKPHKSLKKLTVSCYGGLEFPSWIGDPTYSDLEFVELQNCRKCTSLPSFERLPLLKELKITHFYGDNISFSDSHPTLEKLELVDCPSLIGKLPGCLPRLKKLKIVSCPQLTYSPVSLPSLCELCIEGCEETVLRSTVQLTSLTTLTIHSISNLTCLPKSFLMSATALESLEIEECADLTSLLEEGADIAYLARLERMSIQRCDLLSSLTGEEENLLANLQRLKEVTISRCPCLNSVARGKLPTTLARLKVCDCENLMSLPEGLMNDDNNLQELHLLRFASSDPFPSGQLPASLKRLYITDCRELESIPERVLQHCTELEEMRIDGAINLKILPFDFMQSLTFLQIEKNEGLEMFPDTGLAIPSLKRLYLGYCKNLKSLPNKMNSLTSLQELLVAGCPGITTIPEDGLPPNLTLLQMNCENMELPMEEWGLNKLTSLEKLWIYWKCPADEALLPSSIVGLHIKDVANLKRIRKAFLENLDRIEELVIRNCAKLRYLPKEGLPPSLGNLEISNCPLLKTSCLEKKGEQWRLVKDIPCLRIDGKRVV